MPNKAIYWDACVFLSYINGWEDRVPVLDSILGDSLSGKIDIFTSVLSLSEVAFAQTEKDQGKTADDILEAIDDLFGDRAVVTLVEFHELTGKRAREYMRRALVRKWSLKPMDAIHLATASREQVDEFHTYDRPLRKYDGITGLKIVEPKSEYQRSLFDELATRDPRLPNLQARPNSAEGVRKSRPKIEELRRQKRLEDLSSGRRFR